MIKFNALELAALGALSTPSRANPCLRINLDPRQGNFNATPLTRPPHARFHGNLLEN